MRGTPKRLTATLSQKVSIQKVQTHQKIKNQNKPFKINPPTTEHEKDKSLGSNNKNNKQRNDLIACRRKKSKLSQINNIRHPYEWKYLTHNPKHINQEQQENQKNARQSKPKNKKQGRQRIIQIDKVPANTCE